jgi:hypothetical protein
MKVPPEITELIGKIDSYSHHRMKNKGDVALVMHLSRRAEKEPVFDDLIFHAKFIVRVFGIMKRTLPESEAYPKLSAEFRDGVEKVGTLLRMLVREAPDDVKERFQKTYFAMTQAGLDNLLGFAHDLSWVKNWYIDNRGNDALQ